MKTKLFNLLAAALLVFGVLMPAFAVMAQEKKKEEKTTSVTLHKILMKKDKFYSKVDGKDRFPGRVGFDKSEYIGEKLEDKVKGEKSSIQKFFGDGSEEIEGAYFAWQKKDELTGQWRYINYLGQPLRETEKDKDGREVESGDLKEIYGELTTKTGVKFKTINFDPGDYRIIEIKEKSTYKNENGSILADSKAVPVEITLPIVGEDGKVVTDAHVYPKNTEDKPKIDKNFVKDHGLKESPKEFVEASGTFNGGANYAFYGIKKGRATTHIGQKIPYEVKTKVNAGTEYAKLVWKDSMTNGLTLGSEAVKINAEYLKNPKKNLGLVNEKDYKINQDDRGFTLYLTETGLNKVSNITKPKDKEGQSLNNGEDVEFTLTYSATVNGNAIVDIPEKNDIRLEYGNKPYKEVEEHAFNPQKTKLEVTKHWADKTENHKDISVTYTVKNGEKSYAVTLNKDTNNTTYELGDGVRFKATGNFGGEFIGLKGKNKDWRLSERVAGYNAEIKAIDGTDHIKDQASIINTKDTENPTPLHPTSPEVVVGGRRFVKTDYNKDSKRLAGAIFRVKKDGKYLVAKDTATQNNDSNQLKNTKTNWKT
ncbi:pilin N-terminal domain-containing protein [Streptococcus phocae]|uniref:pilin N-terminal domain-containing protein n=1 Tax=Streptococcus phocae TaxID=119224 RepID=UPI00068FD8AC|nr:pilin N-terminal domain-containing protein [Streptococcus phocae]